MVLFGLEAELWRRANRVRSLYEIDSIGGPNDPPRCRHRAARRPDVWRQVIGRLVAVRTAGSRGRGGCRRRRSSGVH